MKESVAALALDFGQSAAHKTQVLVHAMAGAVDPFFNNDFFGLTIVVHNLFAAHDLLADRLAAFLLNLEGSVPCTDQLAAATQGRSRVSVERGRPGHRDKGHVQRESKWLVQNIHSLSRCNGLMTLPSACA